MREHEIANGRLRSRTVHRDQNNRQPHEATGYVTIGLDYQIFFPLVSYVIKQNKLLRIESRYSSYENYSYREGLKKAN